MSRQILFYLGFAARQDYFTHFEPSQSLDGARMGDPQKKKKNPTDRPRKKVNRKVQGMPQS